MLVSSLFFSTVSALELKNYSNSKLGFKISYLPSWQEVRKADNTFFIKRNPESKGAIISINAKHFPKPETLIEQFKANPELWSARLKRKFPDAKILSTGDTYLGSFPAYFIVSRYSIKNLNTNFDLTSLTLLCVKDNKVYNVTFETLTSSYKGLFPEFEKILSTFNFK